VVRQDEQQRLDNDFAKSSSMRNVREYGLDYAPKQATLAKSGSGGAEAALLRHRHDGGRVHKCGADRRGERASVPGSAGINKFAGTTLGKIIGFDRTWQETGAYNVALAANKAGANVPTSAVLNAMGKYKSGVNIAKAVPPTPEAIYGDTLALVKQLQAGQVDWSGTGKPSKLTGDKLGAVHPLTG
jgi:hypothetical protein